MKDFKTSFLTRAQVRRRTITSLIVFATFFGTCSMTWSWLQEQPDSDDALKPLRDVMNANGRLFERTLSQHKRSKEYSKAEAAIDVRVNGDIGLEDDTDTTEWRLRVVRSDNDTMSITLDELRSLPKTEIIFDFKCVEGWDQVSHWGGVRFSDFMRIYHLDAQSKLAYVGLRTPDSAYYVGIDMPSMMHSQTLLAYEVNGQPLPMDQGYPLRLIIPLKYGIKHLKRIGTMTFSNERPPDYWFENGYDYYAGF